MDLGPRSVKVNLPPPAIGSQPFEFDVRRIRFPYGKEKAGLFHVAEQHPALEQPGVVGMQTRMEVSGAEPLLVEFEIYSAWAFHMYIDKRGVPFSVSTDYFMPTTMLMQLEPGMHDIEIYMDYVPMIGGFAASYNYWEPDGWRVRRLLGVGWDKVNFSLPEAPGAESAVQTR